jgi:hypothetical protein
MARDEAELPALWLCKAIFARFCVSSLGIGTAWSMVTRFVFLKEHMDCSV